MTWWEKLKGINRVYTRAKTRKQMERDFRGWLRPSPTGSALSHMTFETHLLEFVEDCHNAMEWLGVDSLSANAYKLDEFMRRVQALDISVEQLLASLHVVRACPLLLERKERSATTSINADRLKFQIPKKRNHGTRGRMWIST